MLAFAQPAGAVHDDGVFELEGNAEDDAATGDDWENILNEDDSADSTTGIQLDGAPDDADGRGVSIFTGGGSKDQQDISSWKCKDGSVPDKDEILHGFAARYTADIDSDRVPPGLTDDETILYFGADRFDNSGDAQIGFWFLQDPDGVGCTASGGGGTSFSGIHSVGDVLVLSDFTQGGTQPTITIYQWVGSGGTDGSLDFIAGGIVSPATCGIAADDDFCAIVNTDAETSPWDFLNKSGQTDFAHGELYEGGVNLSAPVFGDLADECFSSFVVETRSSQSVTATLKDFVAESFEDCTAEIATAPTSASINAGQSNTDTATVTGSGGGTPTGTVQFWLCGPGTAAPYPLDATGACSTGGRDLGSVGLTPHPTDSTKATATSATTGALNTPGTYCFRATYTPAAGSKYEADTDFDKTTECFTVVAFNPTAGTRQWVVPQDKAVVSYAGGGNMVGTLTLSLYDTSANCTAGTATGRLYTVSLAKNGVSPATLVTANTVVVSTNVTRYWRMTYASTNPAQISPAASCSENTTVSFAGNDGTITVP
jgi:hypothetical protein